ncbi:MAG: hypothetical protein LBT78_12610 [Tannerella sp.]|nr:hypothetical protein [Tannerella sp.]
MKISNRKLHYFNPGHETAVWSGKAHYTSPVAVRKMTADLALLPLWYSGKGDYVLTGETTEASRFLSSLPSVLCPPAIPVSPEEISRCIPVTEPVEAAPWGLSLPTIRLFESLRTRHAALAIPRWEEIRTRLTGRQTATGCLLNIQSLLPDTQSLILPCFCSHPDEIRQFMSVCPPPYLLKMPYSCSGRGLYWLRKDDLDEPSLRWIGGALKKQGQLSIEQALDKVCDFAMEFESDGNGRVMYQGLSVFDTLPKGPFSSSLLGSPELLKKQLLPYVSENRLREVQEAVTTVLTETLASVYQGYLGVDMLIYRRNGAYLIHPMIELNLRYTMGLVAMQLSRRLMHPAAQGRFVIACDAPETAYASHLQMEKTHPLRLTGPKIRSGYFSLCPVTTGTQYRAYIISES